MSISSIHTNDVVQTTLTTIHCENLTASQSIFANSIVVDNIYIGDVEVGNIVATASMTTPLLHVETINANQGAITFTPPVWLGTNPAVNGIGILSCDAITTPDIRATAGGLTLGSSTTPGDPIPLQGISDLYCNTAHTTGISTASGVVTFTTQGTPSQPPDIVGIGAVSCDSVSTGSISGLTNLSANNITTGSIIAPDNILSVAGPGLTPATISTAAVKTPRVANIDTLTLASPNSTATDQASIVLNPKKITSSISDTAAGSFKTIEVNGSGAVTLTQCSNTTYNRLATATIDEFNTITLANNFNNSACTITGLNGLTFATPFYSIYGVITNVTRLIFGQDEYLHPASLLMGPPDNSYNMVIGNNGLNQTFPGIAGSHIWRFNASGAVYTYADNPVFAATPTGTTLSTPLTFAPASNNITNVKAIDFANNTSPSVTNVSAIAFADGSVQSTAHQLPKMSGTTLYTGSIYPITISADNQGQVFIVSTSGSGAHTINIVTTGTHPNPWYCFIQYGTDTNGPHIILTLNGVDGGQRIYHPGNNVNHPLCYANVTGGYLTLN
jgi:hypothetical protein